MDEVLSSGLFDCGNELLAVPGIHAGPLDGRLVGKQIEQLRRDGSTKPLGLDRCQDHGHAEDFRRLRQHQNVVQQVLPIDVGHAGEHLRLMINEDDGAIVRR